MSNACRRRVTCGIGRRNCPGRRRPPRPTDQVPSKHLPAGSSPAGGASATCENLASRSPTMSRTMCGRDAGAGQQGHPGVLEIVEADVQTQTLADRGPVSVEVPRLDGHAEPRGEQDPGLAPAQGVDAHADARQRHRPLEAACPRHGQDQGPCRHARAPYGSPTSRPLGRRRPGGDRAVPHARVRGGGRRRTRHPDGRRPTSVRSRLRDGVADGAVQGTPAVSNAPGGVLGDVRGDSRLDSSEVPGEPAEWIGRMPSRAPKRTVYERPSRTGRGSLGGGRPSGCSVIEFRSLAPGTEAAGHRCDDPAPLLLWTLPSGCVSNPTWTGAAHEMPAGAYWGQ